MGGGTSTVAARRQIRALAADPNVAAVMLHVDSPGGTVAGTEDLARDVRNLATAKPVHAYFEDLAASAAYWIGSQAQHISAGQSTLVGSIGTYAVVYDQSGAAAMEGVKAYVVRAGQFKGTGTPGTEVTPEQLAELQKTVDGLNALFLEGVASGRKMRADQVAALADGRVHVGVEAKKLGLIDQVETFDAALSRLQNSITKTRSVSMATADIVVPVNSSGCEPITATLVGHPPTATVEPKETPATFDQLVAACYGASNDFIVSQLKAKATVSQSQIAWMAFQRAELEKAKTEASLAKAATARPGVAPIGDLAPKAQEPSGDARLKFNQLVQARVANGEAKASAVAAVVADNPDLHATMLDEVNQGRKARK